MFALCTRCIRAIKSRGETVYISSETAENCACLWCENADDDLYNVVFDLLGSEYGGMKGGDENR